MTLQEYKETCASLGLPEVTETENFSCKYFYLEEDYGMPLKLHKQNKNKDYNFISYNKTEISDAKFNSAWQPVWDPDYDFANKPYGGFWASAYTPELPFDSSWKEYLSKDGVGIGDHNVSECEYAVLFNLKDDAKILRIDSLDDLQYLMNEFELDKGSYTRIAEAMLNGDIIYTENKYSQEQIIERSNVLKNYKDIKQKQFNYVLLANYFDGIYLSKQGAQYVTEYGFYDKRYPEMSYCPWLQNRLDEEYNLLYWDIESLLLFNIDCIDLENQKYIKME